MKKIFSSRIITIAVILALVFQPCNVQAGAFDQIRAIARRVFSGEPEEVEKLRQMEVAQSEEGHQEYYFIKPAAPKPQSSEPKPAAVKEGN